MCVTCISTTPGTLWTPRLCPSGRMRVVPHRPSSTWSIRSYSISNQTRGEDLSVTSSEYHPNRLPSITYSPPLIAGAPTISVTFDVDLSILQIPTGGAFNSLFSRQQIYSLSREHSLLPFNILRPRSDTSSHLFTSWEYFASSLLQYLSSINWWNHGQNRSYYHEWKSMFLRYSDAIRVSKQSWLWKTYSPRRE